MPHFTPVLVAIAFAAVIVALSGLARRLPVPTPILQVGAGLLLGLLPGITVPELEPDLVFFLFLPPILWAAAFFTSMREFRANLRPIGLLAIGLVCVTTAAVAVTARVLLPDLPWAVAVALGAIVSPPDAVAAAAIISRLPVPRRVIVVLEGESLVNDASALVLFRTSVAAAVTGSFSVGESVVRFFIDAGVGWLIGIAVGWALIRLARTTNDALTETLLTIVGPYVAWVAAETLHVSAVLACVAGGIHVRQHFSTAVGPLSRVQARSVWDLLIFVLNAVIFLLLGLQFGELIATEPPALLLRTLGVGLVVSAVAIVVRLAWVPAATVLPRWWSAELRRRDPMPPWKNVFLIAWTSMRGIVSLATALALPRTLGDGSPFPYRTEIVLVAMVVILVTLVVQGLTLAPLIRRFAFQPEHAHHDEARFARREALRRALETLDDLEREAGVDAADVAALRRELHERRRHTEHGAAEGVRALRHHVMEAQRRMVVRLRNEQAISDEVLLELERELDLEAMRLGAAR
jgi:CPA1 family monovalent cation:H+ antiporter